LQGKKIEELEKEIKEKNKIIKDFEQENKLMLEEIVRYRKDD